MVSSINLVMGRVLLGMVLLMLATAAAFAAGGAQLSAAAQRGKYLAQMGDCSSCHTNGAEAPAFAGGYAVNSPFGAIYASNITPDDATGIGSYSLEDFKRAMREGVTKSGQHLYPAMPYASFAAASDDDLADLFAYLKEAVKPVSYRPPQTHLPFPMSQRWALSLWNAVFARHSRFKADPTQDAQWNRGAYIVQSFGHCGACHTRRGVAYQEEGFNQRARHFLAGSELDNWYAGDLREDDATGLKRWQVGEIAEFLATGKSGDKVVFGNMSEVVKNSLQYLTPDDRLAIATYLKSIPASSESASFHAGLPSTSNSSEHPGAGMYANFCADCHGDNGQGKPDKAPALAGNSMVMAGNPVSIIRIVLEGGASVLKEPNGKAIVMPHFAHRLTDGEIADTLSYVRSAWGNHATALPTVAVTAVRKDLGE